MHKLTASVQRTRPKAMRSIFYVGVVACLAIVLAPQQKAEAYPSAVRKACKFDYKRLCPQYKPGTPKMSTCMKASVSGMTPRCYNKLVDYGYADRSKLARRR